MVAQGLARVNVDCMEKRFLQIGTCGCSRKTFKLPLLINGLSPYVLLTLSWFFLMMLFIAIQADLPRLRMRDLPQCETSLRRRL